MTPSNFQYLVYALCGVVGLMISTVLILRSQSIKAKSAALIFNPWGYFKEDWYTWVGSLLSIVLCLMMVDVTLHWNPALLNWLKPMFATVGYFGSDLISRLFSAMNNRFNAAIADKVKVADDANGTTGTRTPAAPIAKSGGTILSSLVGILFH